MNAMSAQAGATPVSTVAAQNARTRALTALYKQSLISDSGLRPLWQRMPLNPNEATPAMLALPERISAADQPRLREVARRLADYQAHMADLLRSHGVAPPLLEEWQAGAHAAAALRARLHNGALTWGEFNTRLREVNTAQRMALADIADALQAHDEAAAARAAGEAHAVYAAALEPAVPPTADHDCEMIGGEPYCS
ncbi:MAG TPA: hypothetical protein VGN52_06860 [Burkholderiales bacterium]